MIWIKINPTINIWIKIHPRFFDCPIKNLNATLVINIIYQK